jgi:hypothetical protein
MRSSQKPNRSRGKSSRKNIGNNVNRVYESAGPDGKVRGTPQQVIDKYNALARDAQTSGDRVMAENFLQHAEHYHRLLTAAQAASNERREQANGAQRPAYNESDATTEDASEDSAEAGADVSGMATFDGADETQLVETPEEGKKRGNSRSRRPRSPRNGAGDGASAEAAPAGPADQQDASADSVS